MGWPTLLCLLCAAAPAAAAPAPDAATPDPEARPTIAFAAQAAVASTYVDRGEPQYASVSTPSFQLSVDLQLHDLGPGDLELQAWSAMAMADWERTNRSGSATQEELHAFYRARLLGEWLLVAGGFVYTILPQADRVDGSKELVVDVGIGNLPVTPSVSLWTEVHPAVVVYVEPRLRWEQTISAVHIFADFALGASAGLDREATLDHSTLSVGLGHEVGRLSFGVSMSYTIRLAAGQGSFMERSVVWGLVSMRYSR